jgi:hypothetical protein
MKSNVLKYPLFIIPSIATWSSYPNTNSSQIGNFRTVSSPEAQFGVQMSILINEKCHVISRWLKLIP